MKIYDACENVNKVYRNIFVIKNYKGGFLMNRHVRKIFALVTATIMTAVLFSGCGSSNKTTGNQGKSSKTASNDKSGIPRNETLYFNGQQWGAINDWNPLSSNSNNALGQSQKDSSRTIVYETLYMYNMLDGKMYPLLASGDPVWNANRTRTYC